MELLLDWKSIGSVLATFMFVRTAILEFLPPEIYQVLKRLFSRIFSSLQPSVSIIVEEFDKSVTNEVYEAVQFYLSSQCFSSAQVLKLSRPKNSKNLTFTMDANQMLHDTFDGFKVNWSFHTVEKKSSSGILGYPTRFYQLSFHPKYKEKIHSAYIPHVMEVAKIIEFKNRERKLYTNRSSQDDYMLWTFVPFSHPSTFDTLAMDPVLKQEIKEDLIKFKNRKEFYTRVGRTWKRGYLLYGPPGTGKTSLIAAIANFLEFDIYDLELTAVMSNSQLRKLLISTSSKSVIVVEDVDCSLDLSDRKKKDGKGEVEAKEELEKSRPGGNSNNRSTVSLSGVLNFVDGLWSSCGGERLMIFTTNQKEKLDPALLRPGRMDKHINLSYCEIAAFKTLMKNYLNVEKHDLMKVAEEMLPLVKMTPADIAEVFMGCDDAADVGMKNMVDKMRKRLCCTIEEDTSIAELQMKNMEKEEDPFSENRKPVEEKEENPVAEEQTPIAEKVEAEFAKGRESNRVGSESNNKNMTDD
ncbi:hypothetical protein HHK36_013556 [Tetracentron sinense]|uniref:AAA+ ATPase domain-containing protein n=1 Tax=Tetracentron sinense TaxID=13715 RepID=A0A834Z3I8_TETSI|nr:hypothetical protein HHK36_013556 [Tetracentron sinense]